MPDQTDATILIVDDDSDARAIYQIRLEFQGYRVLLASTAAEARKCLESEKPDVVLLDRKLPDADGLELLPDVPADARVICVSASAAADERDEALEAGVDLYLTKPISPKEVTTEVRRVLE